MMTRWIVVAMGACSVALGCRVGSGRTASDPKQVAVLSDRLHGTTWVEREAALATSYGAGALHIAATEVAADGDRVGGFVAIPSEECLLAYARGSPGIDDLDLYAYGDDGSVLGADEAADPHPALVICPPHPTRAYIVARVAAGRGGGMSWIALLLAAAVIVPACRHGRRKPAAPAHPRLQQVAYGGPCGWRRGSRPHSPRVARSPRTA